MTDVTGVAFVKSTFQTVHDPGLLPPLKENPPATTANTSGAISVIAPVQVASVKVATLAAFLVAGSMDQSSPLSKKDTRSWPLERATIPSAEEGDPENL